MTDLLQLIIPAAGDIKKYILDFLVERGLRDVYIIGAIGSAKELRVATPITNDLPLRTAEVPFSSACEIVGFTGEVMGWSDVDATLAEMYPDKDDPLFLHIHVAAATAGGHMFGGGFRGGKAFRSLRVFMIPV
jgi:predicted DNA-binding protein with PD1-like motif